ncbi:Hippurate hydrolase [Pleomorphomonas sp. T1.2MG-36]|uniref:amidohydrolase n=1 Tax=Pleomorphomonas sp. T1.2MG-36 TaxID=3041167 RepID=UPI002477C56C|nr:amidohydrolase [Pleomorphomonas sp. T1.2MG-36]CAI9413767.1 Hippurate hydrolase [Pleomorphomonas sp. T1.2MG-36]
MSALEEIAGEAVLWRRDLHRRPELLYALDETSAFVAEKLRAFGLDEVVTGVGGSGVVGVLKGRSGNRAVALRADMDALPIEEITGAPWASMKPGAMHACGHDGHTATLLAAAGHLAAERDFAGTVVFVFQPAEEGGAGARAMIEDGLFERFPVDEIYGIHNLPGLPVGRFAVRPGAIMASTDRFYIDILGRGGHAARPHETIDPILVGAQLVTALQSIVARNTDPLASGVVSVTTFHAGNTDNVIPQTARLSGTVRALDEKVRADLEASVGRIVTAVAATFGAEARIAYERGYPVTVNHAEPAARVGDAIEDLLGGKAIDRAGAPLMAAEDFSYYLERVPGAYFFMGNGPSAGLHHPAYDFADDAIAPGAAVWAALAKASLAAAR